MASVDHLPIQRQVQWRTLRLILDQLSNFVLILFGKCKMAHLVELRNQHEIYFIPQLLSALHCIQWNWFNTFDSNIFLLFFFLLFIFYFHRRAVCINNNKDIWMHGSKHKTMHMPQIQTLHMLLELTDQMEFIKQPE